MATKRIQNPHNLNSGKNLQIKEDTTISVPNHEHPIFCFKHLHPDFDISKCDKDGKAALISTICRLSQMTWTEIQLAPKHGLGTEKIKKSSLKPKPPRFITDEVNYLLAFRYNGKLPMVGIRRDFIFHVIFIERTFNTLYNH